VISNQGGFYGTFAYVSEARRLGLAIDPPDIGASQIQWTGRGRRLRVGLMAVGGLSQATREAIIACRQADPFTDMGDFLTRVDPDETEARALIHCGALDALDAESSRTRLLWALARWQAHRRRRKGQADLFSSRPIPSDDAPPPVFPPENTTARLRREFAVLGFLCHRHPMTLFSQAIDSRHTVKADQLARHVGQRVRFAGWLITGKVVHTRHGDPMQFLTFEDETGIVETTFFPEVYRRFCHMLDRHRPYLLFGMVDENWGAVTLTVDQVAMVRNRQKDN
jgi:DNA polymerase-3 subunit alpha/error-prone DNA polymerase